MKKTVNKKFWLGIFVIALAALLALASCGGGDGGTLPYTPITPINPTTPDTPSTPSTPSTPDTPTNPSLPTLTGTVSITGYAEVEQTLTANTDLLGGSGTISYEWKRGGTVIGVNSKYYNVQSADMGATITVTVTRSGNSGSVTSAPTSPVIGERPPTPGLVFTLMGSYYSVSRGTATAAEVIIPAVHEGLPVTTIGDFSSYRDMTSIRIPSRITNIGNNAFSNCSGLTSVNIPDSVMSIGNYAFSNCTGLKSVTIPDSVMSIGSYAFYNNSGLTSVDIPSSLTNIGSNAFSGCSGLTSITIPFFGATLNGTSPLGYLFGTSSYSDQNSSVPASLKTVIITGGNSVPENAFYGCTKLTSITIPDSVTSIGQSAFYGCTSLSSTNIPDNVTSIGQSAFYGCNSLTTNITIPDKVTSIGQNTFYGCSSLPSITIPNNVLSIGQSAFYGCSSLTSVTIPDKVTSIGQSAFSGCNSLTSITIPFVGATLNGTSNTSFSYIMNDIESSLAVIITGGNSIPKNAFNNRKYLKSVTIPNSVTSIGDYAFYSCTNLMSVTIGSNVRSIGEYAFGNTGLTSVTIPNSVGSIGQNGFENCKNLTSITFNANNLTDLPTPGTFDGIFVCAGQNTAGVTVDIGANVTKIPANLFSYGSYSYRPIIIAVNFAEGSICRSIGSYAFRGCSMTRVTIPNSVTSIGESAFSYSSLTSVTIPNSVTSIGESAFSSSSLTSVTINSVGSIGEDTFFNCTSMASVTIGNGVTSIGNSSFSYCTNLTSVTFQGTISSEKFDIRAFYSSTTSSSSNPIPWTLRDTYLAAGGGIGTYTTTAPVNDSSVWKKQ